MISAIEPIWDLGQDSYLKRLSARMQKLLKIGSLQGLQRRSQMGSIEAGLAGIFLSSSKIIIKTRSYPSVQSLRGCL